MHSHSLSIKRRTLLGGALAGCGLLLTGCGKSTDGNRSSSGATSAPEELLDLTYVTPAALLVGYADVLVAQTNGLFTKHGLRVNIQPGNGSSQAIQQVVGGQSLLSRTGGIDLILAVAGKSVPIRSVGTISQGNPFNVISNKAQPIKSPTDMRGKVIGVVSLGGGTETILNLMLEQSGIEPKSVRREVVGNAPSAFALIDKGRIDAFIASADTLEILKAEKAPLSFFATDEHAPIPGQVYVASAEAVQRKDERIAKFLAAVGESVTSIVEDKGKGYAATMEALKPYDIAALDNPEEAKAGLAAQVELWLAAGQENLLRNVPDAWVKAQEIMTDGSLIKAPVAPEKLYTNEFLGK